MVSAERDLKIFCNQENKSRRIYIVKLIVDNGTIHAYGARMTQFGKHALALADGTQLSTRERIELGLDEATASSPLALSQTTIKKITQNQIRSAMSDLAHQNIGKVQQWLDNTAESNPALAVQLFLQLAEFSLPKLKAVSIDVRDEQKDVRQLSIADLQSIVSSQ